MQDYAVIPVSYVPLPSIIDQAAAVLRAGGVICHATETCYGFAASLFSKSGIAELYAVKEMPKEKPLSILVSSLDEAKRYGVFSDRSLALANYFWPGPLTILLPRTDALPSSFNPESSLIGMRVSPHPVVQLLLEELEKPIVTTSANLFGEAEAYTIADVRRQLYRHSVQPDLVLDSGHLPRVLPSTLVDGRTLRILREGTMLAEEIYKVDRRFNTGGHNEA